MPVLTPLQKTAAEFKRWRANKSGPGESTPVPLRKQAITLTTQYSVSQVTKALGLSGSVIKRWQTELAHGEADYSTAPQPFVSLPKAAAQASCVQRMTLSFDDGVTIELTGDISSRLALVITEAIWRDNAERANREVA